MQQVPLKNFNFKIVKKIEKVTENSAKIYLAYLALLSAVKGY